MSVASDQLRQKAAHARMLMRGLSDPQTLRNLEAYAAELEAEADSLDLKGAEYDSGPD